MYSGKKCFRHLSELFEGTDKHVEKGDPAWYTAHGFPKCILHALSLGAPQELAALA